MIRGTVLYCIIMICYFSRNQSNFHVFYYLYDGLEAPGKLKEYFLSSGRNLRYLRITDNNTEKKRAFKVRNNPQNNVLKFEKLMKDLKFMDMEEYREIIWRILVSILLLGEIQFVEGSNGEAELDNNEVASRGKGSENCQHFLTSLAIYL